MRGARRLAPEALGGGARAPPAQGSGLAVPIDHSDHRAMGLIRITWRVRAAAALLLAFLLGMSDGSTLWSETIPGVVTVGAIASAAAMIVMERRGRATRGAG
jgi:hypothetical protein